MTAKDSVDDFSGAHPFGVVEKDELDLVLVEKGLVDLQALEVRRSVVLVAADRVDDVVGSKRLEQRPLVAVVRQHDVDVLTAGEYIEALEVAHDRPLLERRRVAVGVQRDQDVSELVSSA